ncbi:MAG: hypothetical protein ACPGVD_04915, partial [Flavobacteriales bacterium]
RIETALDEIQSLGRFYFSYNSKVVDGDRIISYSSYNESVNVILDNILGEGFAYKHRGKYLIIQKSNPVLYKKKKVVIKGTISSAKDSSQISDVTIYEIDKLKTTSSNKNGDFNLTVSSEKEEVSVLVSKENYKDTLLSASDLNDSNQTIYLEPETDTAKWKKLLGVDSIPWLKNFYNDKILNTIRNVELSENRKYQFSLVPAVGTNGKLGGKITNKFSFNLIGGYAYGLDGLELGGVFNLLSDSMRGAQIAGFGNVVGGDVKGIQMAGAVNYCHDSVKGMQLSGAANIARGNINGLQIGGGWNIAPSLNTGGQIAGAFNYSDEINDGFQISGAVNYSNNTINGFQIAGAVNVNKNRIVGTQISGLLNYTKNLKGLQIAPFNFSDTVEKGLPIGVFSYVKSGFHKFEISYSDYLRGGLSFRTGVHKFYNILSLDYYHHDNDPLASFGYGVGTQLNFNKKAFSNFELSAQQIISLNNFSSSFDKLNMLAKANLNFGVNLGKHLSILGGPEVNFFISDNSSAINDYDSFSKRRTVYSNRTQSTYLDVRLGYRVALRF